MDDYGYNPYFGFQPYSGNAFYSTVYVGGTYLVNDNLTISGNVYKTFNMGGMPSSPDAEINPRALDLIHMEEM